MPFCRALPFGFFKKKYTKSKGDAAASVFQATGDYTDEICKNQFNGGVDIPEYSKNDGTSAPADYGTTYTSWTQLCNEPCDDGTIDVTPMHYQKSGTKICFQDDNQDGYYTDGDTIYDVTESSCDASTDLVSWNHICNPTRGTSSPQTCTGSKLSCMSGPL